ncbi:MAG: hypothetical protein MRERV_7c005 [Mycoplasmataceae bacterium RV_VA103A]|nr:MAG: hypothetical protein MRERV_7c005 [Mycoplasmataceae bacterium RV_VA103A]
MNRLENLKKDNFHYFSDYKRLSSWEDFLTSDYWKSWRTRIPVFQTEKELVFYTQRLGEIASLISRCRKYGTREEENADLLLIKQEEIRLQNISSENFKKEYRFADVEFKELSTEEILNDPWFNKEIDKFFGLENGKFSKEKEELSEKDSNSDVDYQTWTKEQLISEINHLKAENEQLKNNQTLTSSERQERLQQNQQKLEEIASYVSVDSKPNNSNNNFPTGWVVGGGILATAGLIGLLIVRKKKKR